MDLNTYYKLIQNEKAAKNYLSKKCLKNGHRFCPRCNQRKLYKLSNEKRRCSKCKYTFHDFSCRWINHGRLTSVQWLSLIKLFELELSVRKMAEQMNLSYNTVYKAVQTIRYSILSHSDGYHAAIDKKVRNTQKRPAFLDLTFSFLERLVRCSNRCKARNRHTPF